MKFSLKLRTNKLKTKHIVIGVLVLLINIILIANLFRGPDRMLRNCQLTDIPIDSFYEDMSRTRVHSRTDRYIMISGDTKYYVSFPASIFELKNNRLRDEELNKLQNETPIVITASVSTKQTFTEWIHRKHRIYAFSVDGTEYLDIQTSKDILIEYYAGVWLGVILIGAVCNIGLFLFLICDDVLQLKKPKRRKKTGRRSAT